VITIEHKQVFGRLVTDFTLPAWIFTGISRQPLKEDELMAVFAIMISLFIFGAFILVSSFGSSSKLGYALITQVFSSDPAALREAPSHRG
jgi:predicted permease